MRLERTKVSFDCTQNRFSKVKFQTDGWRGGGGGGGLKLGSVLGLNLPLQVLQSHARLNTCPSS